MRDPVCGMNVEAKSAAGSAEWDGQTYYFCGEGCMRQFKQDPAKFAGAAKANS